jgi:hypothetical protein
MPLLLVDAEDDLVRGQGPLVPPVATFARQRAFQRVKSGFRGEAGRAQDTHKLAELSTLGALERRASSRARADYSLVLGRPYLREIMNW